MYDDDRIVIVANPHRHVDNIYGNTEFAVEHMRELAKRSCKLMRSYAIRLNKLKNKLPTPPEDILQFEGLGTIRYSVSDVKLDGECIVSFTFENTKDESIYYKKWALKNKPWGKFTVSMREARDPHYIQYHLEYGQGVGAKNAALCRKDFDDRIKQFRTDIVPYVLEGLPLHAAIRQLDYALHKMNQDVYHTLTIDYLNSSDIAKMTDDEIIAHANKAAERLRKLGDNTEGLLEEYKEAAENADTDCTD